MAGKDCFIHSLFIFPEVVLFFSLKFQAKLDPSTVDVYFQQQKFTRMEMIVGEPYHGCSALYNTNSVQNKIVLIERGYVILFTI